MHGTRHGICLEPDGLLAGRPGLQLTWMYTKIGDHVVTPRIGKPVEVQALWLNALAVLRRPGHGTAQLLERGLGSFAARFDNGTRGLFDVVDVNHERGALDASLRPSQLFAIGGLPLSLLPTERCREIVDLLAGELWRPLGLRSLGRSEPGYTPRYAGGVFERDSAYHQARSPRGWVGPFIEAWSRVVAVRPRRRLRRVRAFSGRCSSTCRERV